MQLWRPVVAALTAALAACGPATAPTPEPTAAPSPALWRLADADSEIWLFGTVHALPEDLAWRSPAVDAAFAQAERVVFEVDPGVAGDEATHAALLQFGFLPPGQALRDGLPAPLSARLEALAPTLGLDLDELDRLRPWLAAQQVTLAQAMRAGALPELGVEQVLSREASGRRLVLRFLESPEQQIRVLADLAPTDQLTFLEAAVAEAERGDAAFDALTQEWVRGDIAALEQRVAVLQAAAGPAVYERLITQRNAAFAAVVLEELDGAGVVFVAVGAAHLVGPDGVVARLRSAGLAVDGP
jgi:hypothetical protein